MSSQRASSWDPATLIEKSHWIPAQKHTGMTYRVILIFKSSLLIINNLAAFLKFILEI